MSASAPYVAVAGSGDAPAGDLELAEAVGRGLAAGGAIVVCGGRGGVMEAACRGAKDAGGTTLGILPGSDRSSANRYVDLAVVTGLGQARNALVARTADALVAIGGSFGTLSEIAFALRFERRVVGLGTWELRRGGRDVEGVLAAADPEEAVRLALAAPARG
ncbi:MAG TPA: TIGR00725 family protein [Thermoleophilaceae bacterium]